ncbi:MAG: 2-oxo-4-hydroxy-4-carboxy-5-ureidoimidazoline decarboxylase [Thermoleophilia bacterium]
MSDADEVVARFGHVAEHAPWVAERAARRGPFADRAAVAAAFAAVVREAHPAEQVDLIAAHPELAGRAAAEGDLTPASAAEQASAGLDRLAPGDLARLRAVNAHYRTRFGVPFVIRVRGRSIAEILEAGEARLGNEADEERRIAVEEIADIMRIRIEETP